MCAKPRCHYSSWVTPRYVALRPLAQSKSVTGERLSGSAEESETTVSPRAVQRAFLNSRQRQTETLFSVKLCGCAPVHCIQRDLSRRFVRGCEMQHAGLHPHGNGKAHRAILRNDRERHGFPAARFGPDVFADHRADGLGRRRRHFRHNHLRPSLRGSLTASIRKIRRPAVVVVVFAVAPGSSPPEGVAPSAEAAGVKPARGTGNPHSGTASAGPSSLPAEGRRQGHARDDRA